MEPPTLRPGSCREKGGRRMAEDRLSAEDEDALARRLLRMDIAIAIAAGILSLGLFYLAPYPA